MENEELAAVKDYFETSKNRSYRNRISDTFSSFIHFLQKKELTTRNVLLPGTRADETTKILRSDLTEVGYSFYNAIFIKWLEYMDRGGNASEIKILEDALAKLRKAKKKNTIAPSRKDVTAATGNHKKPSGSSKSRSILNRFNDPESNPVEADNGGLTGPVIYDKAKWHYEGEFPADLPMDAAYVHTGMLIGWLIEQDMIKEEFKPEIDRFKKREITGPKVYEIWDGTLTDDMLTEEGNSFLKSYFLPPSLEFFKDYQDLLVCNLPSFYHVSDNWENYGILKKRIDKRYKNWKAK